MIHITTDENLSISHSLEIIILKPPEIVIRQLHPTPLLESENEMDIVECIAEGAKPPNALVTWQKEGLWTGSFTETVSNNTLRLAPTREFNNAELTCTIRHEALEQPLVKTFSLNVEYPPGMPIIRASNPNCDDGLKNLLTLECLDNSRSPANPS